MKASELIENLAHIISFHGDIDVCIEDYDGGNINLDIVYAERSDEKNVVLLNSYHNPNEDE